jgi:hypothetical protein
MMLFVIGDRAAAGAAELAVANVAKMAACTRSRIANRVFMRTAGASGMFFMISARYDGHDESLPAGEPARFEMRLFFR